MADQDKAKTVPVKALQLHTYQGAEYQPGDEYDVDAEHVESLVVQGKAAPVNPQDVAPAAMAPKPAGSTAVEPMGTEVLEPKPETAKAAKRTAKAAKTAKSSGARKSAPRKK